MLFLVFCTMIIFYIIILCSMSLCYFPYYLPSVYVISRTMYHEYMLFIVLCTFIICYFSYHVPCIFVIPRIMCHGYMLFIVLCIMSDALEVCSIPRSSSCGKKSLLVHARSLQLLDSIPYQSHPALCVFLRLPVF